MDKQTNFRDSLPKLSEDQIKQLCRFTKTEYVEGQWQTMRAYADFKRWHHNQCKLREITEQTQQILV